jgi:transposase-like protein
LPRKRPVFTGFRRTDRCPDLSHDDRVSDTVAVESVFPTQRRLRRTPEKKRRIVEATFVPGASIARVAREHGVNANQVFQWRYEYRKGTLGVRQQAQTRLVPVTVTAEPNSARLLAAEKAAEDDPLYMEKAIDAYKQEIKRGKLDCYTDMEFHKSIAAASKNAMAIKVWDEISPRLAEVLTHTIQLPKVPQESVHDHLKILKAIKERNPQKARAAMRAHLKMPTACDGPRRCSVQPLPKRDAMVIPAPLRRLRRPHHGSARRISAAVPNAMPR